MKVDAARAQVMLCSLLVVNWCIGCAAPVPPYPPIDRTAEAQAAFDSVERQLVVLPVASRGFGSAFPVNTRNAVTAAHVIREGFYVVGVKARPMVALYRARDAIGKELSLNEDLVTLHSTSDRFTPNIIDTSIELIPGDRVYIGGIRSPEQPCTASNHANAKVEIVEGVVCSAQTESSSSANVIAIEVPWRNYHGFSGGPAAILDEDGVVRVWGVIVAEADRIMWPWNTRTVALVVRLDPEFFYLAQKVVLCAPGENSVTTPAQVNRFALPIKLPPSSQSITPRKSQPAASQMTGE